MIHWGGGVLGKLQMCNSGKKVRPVTSFFRGGMFWISSDIELKTNGEFFIGGVFWVILHLDCCGSISIFGHVDGSTKFIGQGCSGDFGQK